MASESNCGHKSPHFIIDILFLFRALLSSLGIAAFLALFAQASVNYPPLSWQWCELVDYGLWAMFVLSLIAGLVDLIYFKSNNYSLASTYAVEVFGITIIVLGRVSSMLYSLTVNNFLIQPIGGGIVDTLSLQMALFPMLLGSFTILASTSVSTLFKKHISHERGPRIGQILSYMIGLWSRLPLKLTFVVSFMLGFLVRMYPEILYWPLPIGWDTLEYIAHARDFVANPSLIPMYLWMGGWRNLPPLLTYISGSLGLIGLDPLIFFKFYPAVVMGLLSLFSSTITYEISRSKTLALISSLMMIFNPYIIGQSQQLQRHVLGATLLLLYLYACQRNVKHLWKAVALMLLAASYELGAILAAALSLYELMRSDRMGRIPFAVSMLVSILSLIFYAKIPQETSLLKLTPSGVSIVGGSRYTMDITLTYTITCLLLLLPSLIVIKLVSRSICSSAKVAIIFSFIAFLFPILTTIAIVEQPRWFGLLLILLTPYLVCGLRKVGKWILVLLTIALLLAGVAYTFTDSGYRHFDIWRVGGAGFPWKLQPCIVDFAETKDIAEIISKAPKPTIVNFWFYPELHIFLRNPSYVTTYWDEPTILHALCIMTHHNLTTLYVVSRNNLTKEHAAIINDPNKFHDILVKQYNLNLQFNISEMQCFTLYSGKHVSLYEVRLRDLGPSLSYVETHGILVLSALRISKTLLPGTYLDALALLLPLLLT